MREYTYRLISTLAFTTAAVLVLAYSLGNTTAFSAGGPSYTSTWKATRLIQVSAGQPRSGGVPVAASVGVAEWEVTGSTASGTRFREVWSVPGGRTVSGSIGSAVATTPTSYTGIALSGQEKKYLVGFSGMGRMSVSTVPVSSAYAKTGDGDAGGTSVRWASYNGAARCGYALGEVYHKSLNYQDAYSLYCMRATGAYGFTFEAASGLANVSGNAGDGTYPVSVSAGSVLPLEWTINGYVCKEAGDTSCDAGGSR
jgi:hypothetical protein